MELDIYHVDAFSDKVFSGNQACVVILESWLPDNILLNIAKENAVAETAFFIIEENKINLRWFTPDIEMDLCGHATLAAAHALYSITGYTKDKIIFSTISGELTVIPGNNFYTLDFPSRPPIPAQMPEFIRDSLNIQPSEVFKARDYMLVYKNEDDIKNIVINRNTFDKINLGNGGVIVTAPGVNCDFVSRFFTPQSTILEDPVTGSAHCTLIPFWSKRLGKKEMNAVQLSERTGRLHCVDNGERVLISGNAVIYSVGKIYI
jgi:PhzF family phenazine biosynthesis protein